MQACVPLMEGQRGPVVVKRWFGTEKTETSLDVFSVGGENST